MLLIDIPNVLALTIELPEHPAIHATFNWLVMGEKAARRGSPLAIESKWPKVY